MWQIQLAFLVFMVCRAFLSSLTHAILLLFSHNWFNWSPSCSGITYQKFQGISYICCEMSRFQLHTKLCPKCSISLVSSLNISQIYWETGAVLQPGLVILTRFFFSFPTAWFYVSYWPHHFHKSRKKQEGGRERKKGVLFNSSVTC